ncbi:hypothetical protein FDP25_01275 [Roseovarius sp. A21]|uniref:Universal stress protein family protein n=1 Tax=Roseovarius bejariae TaxID=2576383 RepID=A0A844CWQ9_9RHOB|nr:hypothetical protein [Roseovarius bejariae]MRU14053.1 hypothetical protein [Roseovarius bejariae]
MSAVSRKLIIAAESLEGADAALSLCRAILGLAPAMPSGLIIEPVGNDYWSGRDPKIISTRGILMMAPPRVDRLRRMARRDAAELGARLSDLAKDLDTEWDCTVAAGDLVGAACAELRDADILLLGQRPLFRGLSRVVLLGGEKGPSEAARILAGALAQESRTSVAVLSAETCADDQITALVERTHAVALVLDLQAGPVMSEESLKRVYMAARCPIVALGGARFGRITSKAGASRVDRRD